ncbi:hypothetical protein GQ600_7183 [Phytophthora cactorum]|nr:hypothetical protein GQ600_7183 [Phytophthora cactorum]
MRNRSQQNVLLEQMRERELRSLRADQTHLEVQLNARLLEKIHQQAGAAQSQAEDVVSETQNRSRELQEQEQALQHRQSQRAIKF